MPILDIQRRGQQIGRLRIGEQVSTGKKDKDGNDKMRPSRLSTFRFTTQSRPTAEAIAELYGGEIRDWNGEFEVITRQSAIGVTVPPRDQVVSQWYEMWSAGGCQRRCDSQREQISNGPCLCPHADDLSDAEAVAAAALQRADMARANPPQACKLVTRISVMIPDLPGLGVFRLDSGSYYAAVEIGDSAALMQMARDKGVFLPAVLRIEHRKRVAGGQTKKYPVPVLEVLATFRDLATGAIEAGGMAAQLPPAPGEQRRALAAGTTTAPAASPAPAAAVPPQRPAPQPDRFAAVISAIRGAEIAVAAQRIADAAMDATTPEQMKALGALAEELHVMDDPVCTDDDNDIHEILREFWRARWVELGTAGQARTVPAESVQDAFPETEMVP
jgi:hypothetical protein